MYATIARTLLEKGEEGGVNKRWSEREARGGERERERQNPHKGNR